jgi:hypothetical protein
MPYPPVSGVSLSIHPQTKNANVGKPPQYVGARSDGGPSFCKNLNERETHQYKHHLDSIVKKGVYPLLVLVSDDSGFWVWVLVLGLVSWTPDPCLEI